MQLECYVDGDAVSKEQLRVRTMNFSQHWRTPNAQEAKYLVVLSDALIAQVLGREWREFIQVVSEEPDPEGDPPVFQVMYGREWPDPASALAETAVAPLVLEWFAHSLLLECFGDGRPDASPGFVINTAEVASLNGRWVLQGLVGRAETLSAYQDV